MRDTELYRQLLGLLPPWEPSRIEISVDEKRVDVWTQHPGRTRFTCPECDLELPVYDHGEERSWRHSTAARSSPTCTHGHRASSAQPTGFARWLCRGPSR